MISVLYVAPLKVMWWLHCNVAHFSGGTSPLEGLHKVLKSYLQKYEIVNDLYDFLQAFSRYILQSIEHYQLLCQTNQAKIPTVNVRKDCKLQFQHLTSAVARGISPLAYREIAHRWHINPND